jgi:hypothetical protein
MKNKEETKMHEMTSKQQVILIYTLNVFHEAGTSVVPLLMGAM